MRLRTRIIVGLLSAALTYGLLQATFGRHHHRHHAHGQSCRPGR
jgi:hypothetical protein